MSRSEPTASPVGGGRSCVQSPFARWQAGAAAQQTALHEAFWRGEGPSLILICVGDAPLYETTDYYARFHDPVKMWEAEIERARPVIDRPTDGIPTVRPNLGTIFVPALAGQEYLVRDGQMPWPNGTLTREAIRAARRAAIVEARLMRLSEEFYQTHAASADSSVTPVLAVSCVRWCIHKLAKNART